jgi:hypothetical protein
MERLITIIQVVGLIVLSCNAAIGFILLLCKLGDRHSDFPMDQFHLSAIDSGQQYRGRHGDHPTQRFARRAEDQTLTAFLAECE